jgi:hypothetical protein
MAELELSAYGTATLGGLIAALERAAPVADVEYDFCYLAPTTLASYRGYYDHLALGWTQHGPAPYWPKVFELLAILKAADGATFKGWKGGQYRMRATTPVWVANRGHAGGTGIVGVDADSMTVHLRTAKVD